MGYYEKNLLGISQKIFVLSARKTHGWGCLFEGKLGGSEVFYLIAKTFLQAFATIMDVGYLRKSLVCSTEYQYHSQ